MSKRKYASRRARQLVGHANVALAIAATVALLLTAALLGSAGTMHAMHWGMLLAVVSLVLIGSTCIGVAVWVEDAPRRKKAKQDSRRAVAAVEQQLLPPDDAVPAYVIPTPVTPAQPATVQPPVPAFEPLPPVALPAPVVVAPTPIPAPLQAVPAPMPVPAVEVPQVPVAVEPVQPVELASSVSAGK